MTRPLRVLLVDDNPSDRFLAEQTFALLDQPYTLITAASGAEALEHLTPPDALLPDLVLLDINMPEMNGFTVLSNIKEHPTLSSIPVLMLTTSTADDDIAQAYALHANAYIPKALHLDEFLEQVKSLMEFWTKAKMTTWPIQLGQAT